jgi:hypothetical protein
MNTGQAAVTWLSTRVGIGFNSAVIRARIAFWQREWGGGMGAALGLFEPNTRS